jgi:uncharacterized protein YegP (UPF0339 family)
MPTRPFPSFYIFIGRDGLFHWHYQHSCNHKIEADSGEGYDNYDDCRAGITMIKQGAAKAPVWQSGEVTKLVSG